MSTQALLKDLQEKRNAKAAEIKTLGDKQATWTAEDRSAWEKVNGEYDAIVAEQKTAKEAWESSEAVQERLKAIEAENRAKSGDKRVGVDAEERRRENPEEIVASTEREFNFAMRCVLNGVDVDDIEARAKFKEARDKFGITRCEGDNSGKGWEFRSTGTRYGNPGWTSGGVPMNREFRVGLDVATSGAAKETIPQGFMAQLEKKTLEFGHVRQVCRVISTPTGNTMPWPVVDDTSNEAAILAEATTISTSVDPTFSAISFLAYKLSSKPIFTSAEILQDSAFDLGSEIGGLIGERFGRGESTYETTGTNSSQPQGIVAAAGTGVTSAAAAAFTPDELLGVIHSLDPSYRMLGSCGFMVNDSVLLYVRKFKDATGNYLWQPGYQAGVPDRLAGYPVAINQKMTGTTSGVPVTATKHVLFGAFEKYVVRDVGGVRLYRLEERYRDTDQTAFIAFKRFDARALNTSALKVLLQA